MANEEQLPDLELSLSLSFGGSGRRMPPAADGATGGLLSLNFGTEGREATRGYLPHPTERRIGAAPAVASSAEERLVLEKEWRESRKRGRDSREEELLEAHRQSFGSILGGTGNPRVVPVQYPLHPQMMYVPAVDGYGVPCMIPCLIPAVFPAGEGSNQPVGCRCSGSAGKGVAEVRTDSTGSSSSARNMSKISGSSSISSDERGKSLHTWEKSPSQKDASFLVQGTNEKLISTIPNSDITSASAIPMFEGFNLLSKPIVAATGDGPNGNRITGVLYKYNQSEEVSILCACHGMSFSPTEFVRHAGGTETTHPLRQIVVVRSGP